MGTAGRCLWLGSMLLFAMLAEVGCNRPQPASESNAASTSPAAAAPKSASQEMTAGISVHAADAFYDPPANVPQRPGALIRSEPLKGVTLAPGMKGWRILYTTTVNDTTPATAVATVFAPVDMPRVGVR